jgi:hypothetical protein
MFISSSSQIYLISDGLKNKIILDGGWKNKEQKKIM